MSIALTQDPYFKDKNEEEITDWVRDTLAKMDIYSVPSGMSYGAKCNKERYENYKKNKDAKDIQEEK